MKINLVKINQYNEKWKKKKSEKLKQVNVNWLKVCKIGLEVLIAVGTGLAVFAGVSRAINVEDNAATPKNDQGNNFNNQPSNAGNNNLACCNSGENKIATGLRATQNSMEKMISVVSSIAMVAESIGLIFGKTADRGYNQSPWCNSYGGYNGGWMTQTQPSYSGYGLRQVTPFVQEVGYYPSR